MQLLRLCGLQLSCCKLIGLELLYWKLTFNCPSKCIIRGNEFFILLGRDSALPVVDLSNLISTQMCLQFPFLIWILEFTSCLSGNPSLVTSDLLAETDLQQHLSYRYGIYLISMIR